MIAKILGRTIHQRLRRLTSSGKLRESARENLREILDSFEAGIGAGFDRRSAAAAEEAASGWPWHRRAFYWEGVAFALAARHACTFRRGCPDHRRLIAGYRAVHYTGYGLWNGLARIYPLPRVSLAVPRWSGVGDFARYRPLVIGGAAFATAFFRGRFDRRQIAGTGGGDRRGDGTAAVHGLGRALWILHMDDPRRVVEVLDEHGAWRRELLEGIGAAIALTGVGVPADVADRLDRFPATDRPSLLRGAGAALLTLVEEDPGNRVRLQSSIRQPALLDAWERVRRADEQAGDGADWYRNSLETARALLP